MPQPTAPLTIVVLDILPAARAAQMRALLPPGFTLKHATEQGEAHLLELVREADFAITGQVIVSAKMLRQATRLKLLHKWGVGVDTIDIAAAQDLGIGVARTTGSNALPVAEFTIGLMLSALRCMAYAHHQLKQGKWHGPGKLPAPTMLLSGKTVGLIGLGAIGQNVARLVQGFGCRVLYTKPTRLSLEAEAALKVHHASLDELLAEADVVSLHCPLTPETAGLIDSRALERMKRTAVLVNVARGGVLIEEDLVRALRQKTIMAAAMDVFSVEPLPSDSPLLGIDTLVLTPHLAAVTADTFEPTVKRMFENIHRVSCGESVPERDHVA
ncbi:MAG: 2-hydroxyacid dehydrogenase [Beijerinckiaceae bacterium]